MMHSRVVFNPLLLLQVSLFNNVNQKGGKYHCTADLLFDWFEFEKQVKLLLIQHKKNS